MSMHKISYHANAYSYFVYSSGWKCREEDENKKRTMFLLSLREVAEKRDRKTCAANSFSCMNVLFIKIKIFVGIKFLEKGENVG